MTPVLVFNPITKRAVTYKSVTAAAHALHRDPSTVHRAMSGDRGCYSTANKLVFRLDDTQNKFAHLG